MTSTSKTRQGVADEERLGRKLGAFVGRREHRERVAEVLDVPSALLHERVACELVGGAGHLACDPPERSRDAHPVARELDGPLLEARVAEDLDVRGEERRSAERARRFSRPRIALSATSNAHAQHLDVTLGDLRRVVSAGRLRRPPQGGHGADREARRRRGAP